MEAREPARDEVLGWLEAVQRDLDQLQERLTPLLEEQRRLEARRALLKDLLSSFEEPGKTSFEDASRSWAVTVQPAGSIGDYVRDRAEEILREAGRALHINEIHAEFERRGFHIPGAGRPVNLIVHLRKASGIASPARGMYGLREHVGAIPVQRKSSRKKQKRGRRPARKEV
jgi:cell division septum initiation protein DivIVA